MIWNKYLDFAEEYEKEELDTTPGVEFFSDDVLDNGIEKNQHMPLEAATEMVASWDNTSAIDSSISEEISLARRRRFLQYLEKTDRKAEKLVSIARKWANSSSSMADLYALATKIAEFDKEHHYLDRPLWKRCRAFMERNEERLLERPSVSSKTFSVPAHKKETVPATA